MPASGKSKLALPVLLAVTLLLPLTAQPAKAATYVRTVQFTPQVNWTGLVLLEMPESFISGTTGLYVSNTSDCSFILPTYWTVVGRNAYIVFDPGKPLKAGQRYTYYLCYGDLVAPNALDLASCIIPGECNLNVTAVNAALGNNNVTVHIDNTLESVSTTFKGDGKTQYTAVLYDSGYVYAVNATIEFTTQVNQTYTVRVISPVYTVEATPSIVDQTVVLNTTNNYDTGIRYYDTGVYTVFDAGRRITVSSGYITINVYDSDRDTYYVYVYIDGNQYQRYYQRSRITLDLTGLQLQTIAVRVYDTERNDWVRAYGTVHVEAYNLTYRAEITINHRMGRTINVSVEAGNPFSIDASARLLYYKYKTECGNVEFDIDQYLAVLEKPGFNHATIFAMGSDYANASIKPGSYVAVHAGGSSESTGYGSGITAAASPDAASASVYSTGTILGVIADEYPESPENLTLRLCVRAALPGDYGVTWSKLLVFEALSNYTDYVVGGASEVQTGTGGGGGGGGGTVGVINGSIVVNVETQMDPDIKLLIIVLSMTIPFILGLFSFYKSVSTDQNIWIATTIALFGLVSLVAYVFGFYDQARSLLGLIMLALYPVVERAMDWILSLLGVKPRRH